MGIKYTTLGIDTPDIAPDAISEGKIDLEVAEVTVPTFGTTGTATVTAGNTILGYYPSEETSDPKTIESIVIDGTTLTITVKESGPEAKFKVVMIKA
ncbi:hypothetical protein ES703_49054 [subsurface metagenome]